MLYQDKIHNYLIHMLFDTLQYSNLTSNQCSLDDKSQGCLNYDFVDQKDNSSDPSSFQERKSSDSEPVFLDAPTDC